MERSHPLRPCQDVAFHRGFEFGLARIRIQTHLRVQGKELEMVPVRFVCGRTRPVISGLAKVVQALLRPIRQPPGLAHALGKGTRACRKIPDCPMIPGSRRRVGIVDQQRKGFGSRRRFGPAELRRDIGATAGEPLRNLPAVRETRTRNAEVRALRLRMRGKRKGRLRAAGRK